MWSPKRTSNGGLNHFYETMREVAPGDVIFSFCDTRIRAMGIAATHGYSCPRPAEFGTAGINWGNDGWRVDVHYVSLQNIVRPKDHMAKLRDVLPDKYSPLQENGNGNQGVYLTEVPFEMADRLIALIGREAHAVMEQAGMFGEVEEAIVREDSVLYEVETRVADHLQHDLAISETERRQLINARRGQGQFRSNVVFLEQCCRVTGVSNHEHLIASHIKPWRNADNRERIDGNNGLLLTPNVDHLFDKGFISFAGNGELQISPVADKSALVKMGIPVVGKFNVGAFNPKQSKFLDYHVHEVFKRAER